MTQTADLFLKRHGMHPDDVNMPLCCEMFMREMQRGLAGKPSTLMMLPTYVSLERRIPEGRKTAILDAGGTNLRAGVAEYRSRDFNFFDLEVCPIPGSGTPVSWEQFVSEMADRLYPLMAQTDRFGFCFSFPSEATEEMDGRVIEFNKEVTVRDAAGKLLCGDICEKLRQRGVQDVHFALINDTVAALLGGYGMTCEMDYDGYIGFILGTGTNCSYLERTGRISKLPRSAAANMIINMEAGGYGRFPTGDLDRALDQDSRNPGEHLYEKMVSGGYLGDLAQRVLRAANAEGLFRGKLEETVLPEVCMETVSGFLMDPFEETVFSRLSDSEEDLDLIFALMDLMLDRAAKMLAVNLVSILIHADMGRDSLKPACIIAEGSTFVKSDVYQSKILKYAKALAETYGRYFVVLSYEDVNLKGAATAALLAN